MWKAITSLEVSSSAEVQGYRQGKKKKKEKKRKG
jgi:hypothetical protein